MAFGEGDFRWAECENLTIAAYFRTYQDEGRQENLLIVQNLSAHPQQGLVRVPDSARTNRLDLLSGKKIGGIKDGLLFIQMEPYACFWLEL